MSSSPKKRLQSYTKYNDAFFKYEMITHVISHWYLSHESKKNYVEKNIKQNLLPIIIFEKKIVIPPNKLYQTLISNGDTYYDNLSLIEKYIGAFISPDYTPEHKYLFDKRSIPKIIKIHINSKILQNPLEKQMMYEKWYSTHTRHALEGAMQWYTPKIVVELGVYLGCSTVSLLNSSPINITYYGFDFFTHICTNPPHISYSPLDRFFLEYPKLETAVANVMPYSKKHNINFVLYDVLKSNEYLIANKIIPDLLFIDSIKDQHNLNLIIHKFIMLNPNLVIVGDDMICGQVKPAIEEFGYLPFGIYAYIITSRPKLRAENYPKPVLEKHTYPSYNFSAQEKLLIPKSMHTWA